jgi:protein SCO1/2
MDRQRIAARPPRQPGRARRTATLLGLWVAVAAAAPAAAQPSAMDLPMIDKATELVDRRGALVPGELEFVDENQRRVRLADYFDGRRPVLLNLGYYGCPSLCGAVTSAMVDALDGVALKLGDDFEIVTVSIDPKEPPGLARAKKNSYLAVYKDPSAEAHWHFLTGAEEQIRRLAETVGFGYRWNEFDKRYDHGAGLFVLSPDGVLSQVLQGVQYSPRDLRLALVEASQGEIGSAWDRILLTCYSYDPTTQSYSLMVWAVVRLGGALTVIGLAAMIFILWRRERRAALAAAA